MEGIEDGTQSRAIEFRHHDHPGTLVLEIRRSEPGHLEFAPVRDDTRRRIESLLGSLKLLPRRAAGHNRRKFPGVPNPKPRAKDHGLWTKD